MKNTDNVNARWKTQLFRWVTSLVFVLLVAGCADTNNTGSLVATSSIDSGQAEEGEQEKNSPPGNPARVAKAGFRVHGTGF